MKSIIKVLGIIALVAVIGFSMVACGGDDGNDKGKKNVVTLVSVTANGSPTQTTTQLTLTFDKEVELYEGDIILSGVDFVVKGAVKNSKGQDGYYYSDTVFTLPISGGFSTGTLSVDVTFVGSYLVTLAGSPKTVTIYHN